VSAVLDRPRALRSVLGRYATGVAVVTTRCDDGRLAGLTVNSFVSVSLEPPLVLWSIRKEARLMPAFRDARRWAISVLAADQDEIARRFCAPVANRFENVDFRESAGGVPLIEGAVAWLECTPWQAVDGGDHLMLLGRVEESFSADRPPLVFHDGRYGGWQPRP
jgi:flavin reductase (DIM6/NTAB) family NADH-FMN oxidoreductase RutF